MRYIKDESFLYGWMEIWKVHFIVFLMWWIRESGKGAWNTAQLIAKCTPENSQTKKKIICVKTLLVIAVVVFEKKKGACLIGKKLQPKSLEKTVSTILFIIF